MFPSAFDDIENFFVGIIRFYNLDAIFVLFEGFNISRDALVSMLVVKDVKYISSSVQCYFIYVWLFIFNTEGSENL